MLQTHLNLYQALPVQAIQIRLSRPNIKDVRGPLESMPFVSAATLFHAWQRYYQISANSVDLASGGSLQSPLARPFR